MPPPNSQILALRFDNIVGKAVSGDLALLLLALSKACALVAEDENFSQIQQYVTNLLFEAGKQAFRVLLTSQGTKVEFQHGPALLVDSFPLTRRFGDLDVLFQFQPTKTADGSDANELRTGVSLVGLAPIEVIANKMRRMITLSTDAGEAKAYPMQMTNAIIEALLQIFPNGHQFISDLFDMETFELSMRTKGPGILTEIDVDVNIEKLARQYPAVANWLRHLQQAEIVLIDMHAPGVAPEADVDQARCFVKLRLAYQAGWVGSRVSFMLSAVGDKGKLLWFDQTKNECVLNKAGQPCEIEFREDQVKDRVQFRAVLRESIRLAELGCGSFSLPLIVFSLAMQASESKFPHLYEKDLDAPGPSPAHRFELRILHVGDKRFTSMLIRPFFNLGAFRDLLVKDFCAEIDFVPSTASKHDFFGKRDVVGANDDVEIIAGHWSMVFRLKMIIVPIAGIITSVLKMFATTQLASPDDLRFWFQIASALQRDFKLLHGRVSRAEGVKPDFELLNDEQTLFRPKEKGKAKARPSRIRCVIS